MQYHRGPPPGDYYRGNRGGKAFPRTRLLPALLPQGAPVPIGTTMTKVKVNSGACGFTVTITAEKGPEKKVLIALDTACEMVKKMQGEVASVDRLVSLTGFADNPVYQSAARHLKHVSCPVPSAILKAIETETGLNVPKDARIEFVREK